MVETRIMLCCEGLMRAGPSYSTSAAASTSTASETQAKKRKCPATETSVKKKAARPWSVFATLTVLWLLINFVTNWLNSVIFITCQHSNADTRYDVRVLTIHLPVIVLKWLNIVILSSAKPHYSGFPNTKHLCKIPTWIQVGYINFMIFDKHLAICGKQYKIGP